MSDAIEAKQYRLKRAIYRAIGWQVFWPLVYGLSVPLTLNLSDFMFEALLLSTVVFWLFVAFVAFVRKGPLTTFYFYTISYGVPLFSLISLASVLLAWRD